MGVAAKKVKKEKKLGRLSKKHVIFVLLILVLSFQALSYVVIHYNQFFAREYGEKYEGYKADYYSSQYVIKREPKIIPDQTLESFAGGAFLKGLNPILITHDHPPLGRYLVSLSIFIFDNAKTITLFVLTASALGIFLTTYALCKNMYVSLIPFGIFINESLFLNKLEYTPLLEPIQLPFIIFAFYFFIKGIQTKQYLRWFLFCSLMLGGVISIRFFIVGGVVLFSMLGYLFYWHKFAKPTMVFLATLPLSLIVLFLSYSNTISKGYTLIQILGVQEYILSYHNSKFILPFTFWDLLLFNRWHTWWADMAIIQDEHWTIIWPVFTALFFSALLLRVIKKSLMPEVIDVLFLWVICYMVMLSLGYTSTRYFLPLLPFLYITGTVAVYSGVTLKKKKN